MSVIAVKKINDKFEIASDHQMSWGNNKAQRHNNTDPAINIAGKIFQVNGLTIGCAGSVADIGYLRMFSKGHSPKTMAHDDILEWFMEFKDWCNKKSGTAQKDISVYAIIIKDGKCFVVYDFMVADEIITFTAIGSGMWVALGALETGANVEEAIKVAIKYDMYCGGEVYKLLV